MSLANSAGGHSVPKELGDMWFRLINSMTKQIPSRHPSVKDVSEDRLAWL